ncbi:hypothetical protein ONS95_008538 [Cadophora gregata]|uniref:uncharacterized protein n=1 Tax=Cadophora gregata TaxID=51156 RepID=UPI0026DC9F71|nr:uncharacterized protein ONS95_008538 [Cadophora gregata]KAK0100200.1 hypothetical protein ONS95_008538 [Cadophora gregata]KAK0114851.1 hypothetical protein ONS96_013332 [Cadophora gregata f. sp. sojae]
MSPKEQTQSLETGTKRVRKGTKRSRAGCLTCKFRKVKCDEVKPECTRCETFGIKCDGYEHPKSKASLPKSQKRLSSSASKLLPAPESTVRHDTELEQRNFHVFQTELVAGLPSSFDCSFWNNFIMQGCQDEPFIMKAVTALSSFSTAKTLAQSDSHGEARSSAMVAAHMEFAFLEYDKALHLMATTLKDQPSPRKALMMCLLVCCFESMAGNTLAAIDHARSGQKLLDEWMIGHSYSKGVGNDTNSPTNEILEEEVMKAAAFFGHQVGLSDTRQIEDISES